MKTLTIFDVIVQSRGPDDAVYLANSEIWNKVARGNAVLQVEFDNGTLEQLLIVQVCSIAFDKAFLSSSLC